MPISISLSMHELFLKSIRFAFLSDLMNLGWMIFNWLWFALNSMMEFWAGKMSPNKIVSWLWVKIRTLRWVSLAKTLDESDVILFWARLRYSSSSTESKDPSSIVVTLLWRKEKVFRLGKLSKSTFVSDDNLEFSIIILSRFGKWFALLKWHKTNWLIDCHERSDVFVIKLIDVITNNSNDFSVRSLNV